MIQSSFERKSSPAEMSLKGNQLLPLDPTSTIWLVRSGTVGIFAMTADSDRRIHGMRQYLFTVEPGEVLFGVPFVPSPDGVNLLGMVAVAIEATELQAISLADFSSKLQQHNPKAIAWLEGWLNHFNQWLAGQQIPLANLVSASGERFLSLTPSQTLQPPKDEVVWVEVRSGTASWLNQDFPVTESTVRLPLTSKMGLIAQSELDVYTLPTAELDDSKLPDSLALLHSYFLGYFYQTKQQEAEVEYARFQQRNNINRQVTESALSSIAGVLNPTVATDTVQRGDALLVAAGAVGRVRNIKINPPSDAEDLNRVKDPLDAIARASMFRTRRVILDGDWWQEEYDALLGYRLGDNSPIALLPKANNYLNQGSKYDLFDPKTRTKVEVDATIADSVSPEAIMFYRPLPPTMYRALEVFRFGTKGYEVELVTIFVFGIIGTLLGMVTPQATAMLVNNAIPDGDRLLLWQIGLALFASAIGKTLFQLAQGIVSLRLENAADSNLQPAVWDRLLQLSPAFFREYSSGDLMMRLMAVSEVRGQLSGATQRTLLSGIFALLNLVLMFVYSVKLALIGMGIAILTVVVTIVSTRLLIKKQRRQEELDGEINSLTVELIGGVSKLRVAAAEGRAFAAWAEKYSQRLKLSSRVQQINDGVSTFSEALPEVSSILLFWFAILFIQIASSKNNPLGFNAGTFLAFNSAFGIFLGGATDISNTFTDILEIVPLWERAQPILQTEPESNLDKASPGRLTGRLSLDHVTFRYGNEGPLTLEDVSVCAYPGEFVAFVGPSGSGKSTIFRLLLGFETPLSGTVYYDGQDLAGLDVPAVRRQLGVVLQNVRASNGSIFESIASGALVTLEEAWEAARMAGFAEDIEQMPMGMHTIVSEGGGNLSGGQRQRLLIARSLVLKPKIILMDEATSALDNRTQSIVTESLDRMNATRIVIAHRLSTIRNADRIYVVEAGRVVQVGKYDDLVKEDGLFARLVARQLD
ncbi:MAG: NHLP bacteriocin export ABC transporter permease/ATPase subunit [Cyanobacteria bacterium J06600_6]